MNRLHAVSCPGPRRLAWVRVYLVLCAFLAVEGCGAPQPPANPERADQWLARARESYRAADLDDAASAIERALALTPSRAEARLLAAEIALAALEFDKALGFLDGLKSTEALSLRARAYWYLGKVDAAADTLDQLLADPAVKDPWASQVVKLARLGAGREPFRLSGARVALVTLADAGSAMILPVEVNGDHALAMIATGSPEVVVDSSSGTPSWVSLRFGGRLDVRDVPALGQDLSAYSRALGAPIKLLLGANLLRHLSPTLDMAGHQFVARAEASGPPAAATTVRVVYVRGGGMVMRAVAGETAGAKPQALYVNTAFGPPLAFTEAGWALMGIRTASLAPVPTQQTLRFRTIPVVQLGAYVMTNVPAVFPAEVPQDASMNLTGVIGAGLFGPLRVTFFDGGRAVWLEGEEAAPSAPPAAVEPEGSGEAPVAPAPAAPAPAGVIDGQAP